MGGSLSIYIDDLDSDSINFQILYVIRTYTFNTDTDTANPPSNTKNKTTKQFTALDSGKNVTFEVKTDRGIDVRATYI